MVENSGYPSGFDENGIRRTGGGNCPFCNVKYGFEGAPNTCTHLLCEEIHDEGPFVFRELPNSPTTITIFGVDVPTAIAQKFLTHVEESVRLESITKTIEGGEHFVTSTYYLVENPKREIERLVPYVRKHYIDGRSREWRLPRPIRERGMDGFLITRKEIKTLALPKDRWLMLTNLPDALPLFVLPTDTKKGLRLDQSYTLFLRMENLPEPPFPVTLEVLKHLPSVISQ